MCRLTWSILDRGRLCRVLRCRCSALDAIGAGPARKRPARSRVDRRERQGEPRKGLDGTGEQGRRQVEGEAKPEFVVKIAGRMAEESSRKTQFAVTREKSDRAALYRQVRDRAISRARSCAFAVTRRTFSRAVQLAGQIRFGHGMAELLSGR